MDGFGGCRWHIDCDGDGEVVAVVMCYRWTWQCESGIDSIIISCGEGVWKSG